MKMNRKITCAVLAALLISLNVGAQIIRDETKTMRVGSVIYGVSVIVICAIYRILVYIAGGIATFVIVYAGIKWIGSSEDPGARKIAKSMIIYTGVGLIIVLIAAGFVSLIISGDPVPC